VLKMFYCAIKIINSRRRRILIMGLRGRWMKPQRSVMLQWSNVSSPPRSLWTRLILSIIKYLPTINYNRSIYHLRFDYIPQTIYGLKNDATNPSQFSRNLLMYFLLKNSNRFWVYSGQTFAFIYIIYFTIISNPVEKMK